MEVRLKKWGTGIAVPIPASIAAAAGLQFGQMVDVRTERGCPVVEAKRERVFKLAELVRRITAANLHGTADTGMATGREVW